MRNKEFKTKEEYLQYRKDWKREYAELSQTIRETKAEINRRFKEYEYAGILQSELVLKLKPQAKAMLIERAWSKEEAQRQYLASKIQPLEVVNA